MAASIARSESYDYEGPTITSALQAYGRGWLGYVLGALIVAAIANGIYHIPLWQVVDVNLSVFLFFVALGVLFYSIGVVMAFISGEFGAAAAGLLGIVLLTLLPFGAIAGYTIYGWLGGAHIGGESFVYDGFMNIFAKGFKVAYGGVTEVASWLGAAKETATAAADEAKQKVDLATMSNWATIGSFGLAILALIRGRFI